MKKAVYESSSPEMTEKIGRELAEGLLSRATPSFVCLYGDLGAGKTAFVRGFASVISPGSRVKSPTYTVVNEYRKGDVPLFHFDLYRLEECEDALAGIGFDEYVSSGHCIFEWSEYMPHGEKSENAVDVTIEKTGESTRRITVCFPE